MGLGCGYRKLARHFALLLVSFISLIVPSPSSMARVLYPCYGFLPPHIDGPSVFGEIRSCQMGNRRSCFGCVASGYALSRVFMHDTLRPDVAHLGKTGFPIVDAGMRQCNTQGAQPATFMLDLTQFRSVVSRLDAQ
jgi:hypothetical protein